MAYLYNESWQRLLEYLRSYKMGISKQRKWLEQFVSISEMFDYLARKLNRSFELIQTSLKEEIKVVTIIDSDYPKLLKEINDPPAILFLLGNDLIMMKN